MNTEEKNELVQDERFLQANREALYSVGLALLNFLWWYGFAYGLGSGPAESYSYLWGMPLWFAVSCVGGLVLFSLLAWAMVRLLFKEMPLSGEVREGERR